ncbi:MAG: hypothetical protein WA970_18205, partial [Gammaproteobacteria bacterium]
MGDFPSDILRIIDLLGAHECLCDTFATADQAVRLRVHQMLGVYRERASSLRPRLTCSRRADQVDEEVR